MNNKTILLIEDNPSDIDLTKRAFTKGHIVNDLVVLEDGQDALDYIFCNAQYSNRDINQTPALILLDLKLPKIDGLEVLKRIRAAEKIKRIPVVILTSSKEEQDIAISYDLGVNSYIRKPVDFNQFADAIKHLGLYWLVINEPPPSA
jgi:two-component system, response regulator